jgi:hypothetical protein
MSQTDDMNEITLEESALLLDLLYGELEGDAAEAARSEVESNDALSEELDGMRSMRELFAAMPEEEPPAAISAQLLHAAAAEAPGASKGTKGAEAGGGFFAWFRNLFGPVMRYPGLAAAASLVVVVGVAGVLYVSGRSKTAEPVANSKSPPAATSGGEPGGSELDNTAARGDGKAAYTDDVTEAKEDEEAKPAAAADPTPSQASTGKDINGFGGSGRTARQHRPAGKKAAPNKPALAPPPPPKTTATADSKGSLRGGLADKAKAKPRPKKKRKAKAPAKEPPSPDADEAPARERTQKKLEGRTKKEAEKKADKVSAALALHRKARVAAKKGDCVTVRSITLKVRKTDSRYYDTKYLSDPLLRPCLRGKPAVKK